MNKIIGLWENNEIDYYFNTDGTFIITWKTKNANSFGKYYHIDNKIFLEYGTNFSMEWNGTIEILNDTTLHIRDNSNEIGKVDRFKKNMSIMMEQLLNENSLSCFYPIIKYPLSIKEIIESPLIEASPIARPKIDLPLKRSFNLNDLPLVLVSPLVSFILIYGGLKNEIYFISIIGLILLIITFREIGQIINSDDIYKRKMNEFDTIMAPYYKREKEILVYRQNVSNQEWVFNKKKEKILSIFKNSTTPIYSHNNQKIGKSEVFFYNILKNKFGDKILRNSVIDFFETGRAYIPDIIYTDTKNKIFIDIEIDEPYSFENKEPIHYLQNSVHSDEERDKYFLENYWLIIRFSEMQIIQNHSECINTIELVLKGIEDQYIVNKDILLNNRIQIHSCWNYLDAKKMALENFRNKYPFSL
jgi:hypothetical protein